MAKDLAALKKQIDELRATYLELTKKPAAIFDTSNISNAEKAIEALNSQISEARRKIRELEEGFGGIDDTIKSIVNELKKGNDATSLATKSYKKIQSITEDLKNDQLGIVDLNKKDLEKYKDKLKTLQQNIREQAKSLQTQYKITDLSKTDLSLRTDIQEKDLAILRAAQEGFPLFEEINQKLKERTLEEDKINRKLGLTGALLKGISKIPIIGNLIDTNKALDAAREKIKDGGSRWAAYGVVLKSIGKDLSNNILDPLTQMLSITSLFKMFLEIGYKADTQVTNLAKSMGVSQEYAKGTRDRFVEIQNSSNNALETTENLVNAQLELANAFGATQGFSERQVRDQVYLTKQLGLSVEEAASLQQFTQANGINADQLTKTIIKQTSALVKQTGIQLDNKKILGEVAKVSGQLRLQYQNNPELIAKAVIQTQKLGINLEKAKDMAQGLLNFEESIENQISAELITGKELNLERARLLALNGQSAEAAAEMLKQIGGSAEFSKMNVIQQESLAKALGMNANELADSLLKQEQLNDLGDAAKKQIEDKVTQLRAEGREQEANQLMASIGNEADAKAALDKISAQEKFTAAMDKLKSMIASIVEGPAMKFVNMIANLVSNTSLLKQVFIGIATVIGSIKLAGLISQLFTMLGTTTAMSAAAAGYASAITLGIGLAAVIAGIVSIMSAVNSASATSVKDGMVNPNGGLVVSKPEGGIIAQGIKNDNVVFTTNKLNSGGGGGSNIDMSPVIAELQNVRAVLNQILTKEGSVEMDSTKVGTTTNIGTYKVQ